jgi:hypothetical protein
MLASQKINKLKWLLKYFPEETEVFPALWGLSQVPKGSRSKQQKRKNWDNFLGANLQVCHPKGSF